jgi:hypothetical protein
MQNINNGSQLNQGTKKVWALRSTLIDGHSVLDEQGNTLVDDVGNPLKEKHNILERTYIDRPVSMFKTQSDEDYFKEIFETNWLKEPHQQAVKTFCLKEWIGSNGRYRFYNKSHLFENMIGDLVLAQYPQLREYCKSLKELSGFPLEHPRKTVAYNSSKQEKNLLNHALYYAEILSRKSLEEIKSLYDILKIDIEINKEAELLQQGDLMEQKKFQLSEVTLLILGKDPSLLCHQDVQDVKHHSNFKAAYQETYDKISQAIQSKELPELMTLEELVIWCRLKDILLPLSIEANFPKGTQVYEKKGRPLHEYSVEVEPKFLETKQATSHGSRPSGSRTTDYLTQEYARAAEELDWWFKPRKQRERIKHLHKKLLENFDPTKDACSFPFVRDFVQKEDKLRKYSNKFK